MLLVPLVLVLVLLLLLLLLLVVVVVVVVAVNVTREAIDRVVGPGIVRLFIARAIWHVWLIRAIAAGLIRVRAD